MTEEISILKVVMETTQAITFLFLLLVFLPVIVISFLVRKFTSLNYKLKNREQGDGFVFRHNKLLLTIKIVGAASLILLLLSMYFKENWEIGWSFLFLSLLFFVCFAFILINFNRYTTVLRIYPDYLQINKLEFTGPYKAWVERREYKTRSGKEYENYLVVDHVTLGQSKYLLGGFGFDGSVFEIQEAINKLTGENSRPVLIKPDQDMIEEVIRKSENITSEIQMKKRMKELYYYPAGIGFAGAIAGMLLIDRGIGGAMAAVFILLGGYFVITGEIMGNKTLIKGAGARAIGFGFMGFGLFLLTLLLNLNFFHWF
jgi:hypothetical protein